MDKKDIEEMIEKYRGAVKFLAEKIENRKEYEEAKEMGFDYFQGYFFSKPVILTGKDIAPVPTNYFQLLNVLNSKDPDIDHISSLIQQDLSISFKLLKLLNSGAFLMKNKVTSIKQAVVLLGLNEIKKVVTILLMTSLRKTDNQTQLVQMSLTRAHFFEQISAMIQIDKNSLYMFGMFSLIDTILNKEMKDIVEDLPITNELSEALLGKNAKYNQALLLVETIEYGRWNETAKLCMELQLPETELFLQFQKSTLSTDNFFQIGEKSLTGA
jgi:EAL and modified HD-GYP domain-containing signal transduction protein